MKINPKENVSAASKAKQGVFGLSSSFPRQGSARQAAWGAWGSGQGERERGWGAAEGPAMVLPGVVLPAVTSRAVLTLERDVLVRRCTCAHLLLETFPWVPGVRQEPPGTSLPTLRRLSAATLGAEGRVLLPVSHQVILKRPPPTPAPPNARGWRVRARFGSTGLHQGTRELEGTGRGSLLLPCMGKRSMPEHGGPAREAV